MDIEILVQEQIRTSGVQAAGRGNTTYPGSAAIYNYSAQNLLFFFWFS
jgi:hypothetical protein